MGGKDLDRAGSGQDFGCLEVRLFAPNWPGLGVNIEIPGEVRLWKGGSSAGETDRIRDLFVQALPYGGVLTRGEDTLGDEAAPEFDYGVPHARVGLAVFVPRVDQNLLVGAYP